LDGQAGDLMDEFEARVRRLYAAIGATFDEAVSEHQPVVRMTERTLEMRQDWNGGLTDDQIAILGMTAICHVANLRNHLFRWAAVNGKLADDVTNTVRQSLALQVILDLANNEKHGYPPRDAGQSGRRPRVIEWQRMLRLFSGGPVQSSVTVVLLPTGPQVTTTGGGSAGVVVPGEVIDEHGANIGDAKHLLDEAVRAWEGLLQGFGVRV
jgi:hypothetical protein